jgi:hypothetical protein
VDVSNTKVNCAVISEILDRAADFDQLALKSCVSTWGHWQIEGNDGLERAAGFPLTLETPISTEPRFFRTKIQER